MNCHIMWHVIRGPDKSVLHNPFNAGNEDIYAFANSVDPDQRSTLFVINEYHPNDSCRMAIFQNWNSPFLDSVWKGYKFTI